MKSAITRMLVLSAITFTAYMAVPHAEATSRQYFPGSSCKNYYPGDATNVKYAIGFTSGIANGGASSMLVICPLTKSEMNGISVAVGVYITHYGTQTTSCSALSTDINGLLQTANSKSVTGSGVQYILLDLSGTSVGTYYVTCNIPANSKGQINTLQLTESE